MKKVKEKNRKLARRHVKIRSIISGTENRPRLSVFRSNRGMYIQLVDDLSGKTLVSANLKELKESKDKKAEAAFKLGKLLAEKALKKNISKVVFDRGGYKYHGRVKAVADGAREGGLIF
jgi:large subunit ribosomal protein L18